MTTEQAAGAGAFRILVVDDERDVRDVLREMIEAIPDVDCRVETAADGAIAAALLPQLVPHLLLVDLVMPGMNGLDFIALARKHASTRGARIVLVTGFATVANITAAESCGADRVLAKPVKVQALHDLVRQFAREPR